jgi:hypothetical protein
MVSKTKTKTRKKGKQTRGTKKTKPAKNRGTKKTSARLARPKRVSTRTKRSNAQRSRIASPSEQETKILDQGNASSLSSSAESVGSNEHQGELEAMRSNTTLEEITTDQSSQTEENVDDYNTGTSEIV